MKVLFDAILSTFLLVAVFLMAVYGLFGVFGFIR